MRSRRLFIVLLLALASGVSAGWLALNYLRQPSSPIRPSAPPSTEVVVAARDLPLGHVLTAEDIRLAEWPGNLLPEGYSSSVDEILGRGLLSPVALNEPLLSAKLAVKEAGGGLPIVIPEGMRAVSVKVDEVIQVAGFVMPGTRVDVLVTLDQGSQQGDPVTRIVLQNITVLSAGQMIQRNADGEPQTVTVITLLVTPLQAERLVLAATKGRIQLALRNTLDLDSLETRGARVSSLLPPAQVVRRTTRRPTVPASSSRRIEIYRGPQLNTENVQEGGSR